MESTVQILGLIIIGTIVGIIAAAGFIGVVDAGLNQGSRRDALGPG